MIHYFGTKKFTHTVILYTDTDLRPYLPCL